jgi:apolipoprotein N-acyltransferase
VTLNLFFGASWQAPLVLIMLAALVLGVFLGVLVMLPLWLRAKRSRRRAASAAAANTAFDADSTLFPDPSDRRHGL